MCLELKPEAKLQTANKNITVYKRLHESNNISTKNLKSGMTFKSVIKNIKCNGKICIRSNFVYFCTNDKRLNGSNCENRQGYMYSWIFDNRVNISKTTINDKPIHLFYETPYQRMKVDIGEIYHTKLKKYNDEIYEGFHSFKYIKDAEEDGIGHIAKCVIPKGSKYYIGTFDGSVSYASDFIKYIKIIK